MFSLGWDDIWARLPGIVANDALLVLLAFLKILYHWWPAVLGCLVILIHLHRIEREEEKRGRSRR